MKKVITTCFLLLGMSQCIYAQLNRNPLVDTNWLKSRINDDNLVILHVEGADSYLEEHIPGAVFIGGRHYTVSNPSEQVIYDIPDIAQLDSTLESKGVDDNKDILLYVSNNRYELMTRLFFTLNYLGHGNRVYILDGGIQLWKEHGGEVTDEITKPEVGTLTTKLNTTLTADLDYVKEQYPKNQYNIVDARATVFYNGIQLSHNNKRGHIPSSKTIPYTSLLEQGPNGSMTFLPKDEIQAIYDEQGLEKDKPIIVYCHIGQQATMVFMTARMLGYDIKFYDGSFYEWANNNLPVEAE